MAEANEIYDFLLNNVGSAAAQNFKGQHGQSGTDLLLGLASTYNADPNLSSKLTSLASGFDQNAYNNSPEFRAIKAEQDRAVIAANAKINNNITLPAPTPEPTRLTTPNAPTRSGNSGVNIGAIQDALNQAGYGQNANLIQGLLPVTYADNSGFMQDFQEVQGYPNYYVPQQGILDERPVLDAQTPFDPVTNAMLNQYGNIESDFQRSFAVNPDTFRGMVYNPAPYTGAFNYGTNTGGGATDLTSLISAGLLGKKVYDAVKPDDTTTIKTDNPSTNVTDVTTTISNTGLNTGETPTGNVGGEVIDTSTYDANTNTITTNNDDNNDVKTNITDEVVDSNLLSITQNDTNNNNEIKKNIVDEQVINNSSLISGLASSLDLAAGGVGVNLQGQALSDNPQNIEIRQKLRNAGIDSNTANDLVKSFRSGAANALTLNQLNEVIRTGTTTFLPDQTIINLPKTNNFNPISDLQITTQVSSIKSVIDGANAGIADAQNIINSAQNQLSNYGAALTDGSVYDFNAGKYISQAEYNAIANPLNEQIANANSSIDTFNQQVVDANNQIDNILFEPANEPTFFNKIGTGISDFLGTELISGTGGANYLGDLTNVNVGEALSGVGGLLSLADFVDDPNISNTLGTAAGLGGFGLFGSGMAAASPYLGAAALVTGLLGIGQKEPSNYTGYTALDLDTFDPQSFGMGGKKFSQENVDMTSQIMEGIAPYIQEMERKYGVDLKGDLQINYGQRDGLAFNLDNADVTGFNQRLDYNPNQGDISTEVGGDVYRESFSGEGSGDEFITSLLGKIEGIAAKTAAQGGTEYNFEDFDASTDTSLTAEEIDVLPEVLQTQTENRILELNERQYGGLLYENRDAEIADAAGITGGLFFDAIDAGLASYEDDSDATQQDILVQLIRYAEDNPEVDLNEVKITDFYNKE